MVRLFEAFAGYGTSSFALKQLGIEHELVGFSEVDKYAIQCFQQNHGGKNFGDITKINWSKVPDFDLLTGGFPCQAFSTAGKQQGEADVRGQLGLELTKALKEKQPKYFLFENVKGFMSKKFSKTKEKFVKSWEDAGYKVVYKVLNTKDFGIPQNRERVWFVGIREDIDKVFDFPKPFELKLKLKDIFEARTS
jgi:DNA (cytosine-5)-methyltransferase 1